MVKNFALYVYLVSLLGLVLLDHLEELGGVVHHLVAPDRLDDGVLPPQLPECHLKYLRFLKSIVIRKKYILLMDKNRLNLVSVLTIIRVTKTKKSVLPL